MNESRKVEQKPVTGKEEMQSKSLPSSQGDSPKELVPKDISPHDATWADLSERKISSDNKDEREEALLDEAVEESFPASDPVAELPATHGCDHVMAPIDEEEESLDHAIEMTFPASDPIAIPSKEELCHERDLRQSSAARPIAPPR
jgi:hypothetical protein